MRGRTGTGEEEEGGKKEKTEGKKRSGTERA